MQASSDSVFMLQAQARQAGQDMRGREVVVKKRIFLYFWPKGSHVRMHYSMILFTDL